MVRVLDVALGALLAALLAAPLAAPLNSAFDQQPCTSVERGNTEIFGADLPDVELPPYHSLVSLDIHPEAGCQYGTVHVGTRLSACDSAEPEVDLQSLVHASVHRTVNPEYPAVAHITVFCLPILPPDSNVLNKQESSG